MKPTALDKRRIALGQYVERLESLSAPPPLECPPFPYKACPLIEVVAWRTHPIVAVPLVEGELRELTNTLNEWRGALRRWFIWIGVLEGFTDNDAWDLQLEFVESIAFQCLYYPSATRDRFTFVATNALHQVRMSADPNYPDRLDSDPKPGKEAKQQFLSRNYSEAQLEKIASPLLGGAIFTAALRSIDEDDYLELTRNFRNLASHAIAPRLTVGHTRLIVRGVLPATTHDQQPNGTYKDTRVPGKQMVSYGLGGTAPLHMPVIYEANLAEFVKASACFNAYINVLNRALGTLPRR